MYGMKDFLKAIVFAGLFAIPFIPWIVADSMFFPFITGKNFAFRIIVEIVFAAWVALALLDRTYRPRFSWIFVSLSALMIVMFFANFLGEYPLKSFWSNFERMDGYVTLVHFYLLFIVLGTVMRDQKLWTYFMWTTVGAATYVAFDGLQQYINKEGSWRIDSTLGNAAYMAIYMLFHSLFTVWLFIHARQWFVRGILGLLFVLFTYLLLLTATRGTFLALVAALTVTGVYLALFSKGYPVMRKVALGSLLALVVLVGAIFTFKESAYVQDNPALTRIANIDLQKDLRGRMDIWGMAIEGIKERPILGWGQGNFNYVFNAKYDPDIYYGESWYDRVHNIALDWLIAGGIVGFLVYVSIFVAILYYLLWRPFFKHDEFNNDGYFSVPERAILIGIVLGYVVHNLVVFDNIVSYIFFASVLALIHARISEEMPSVRDYDIDPRIVTTIAAPVIALCLGTVVYFVNWPPILAAGDIIDALQAQTIPERLGEMQHAIDLDTFAYQELVEQLAQQAMQINSNPQISKEDKQLYIDAAESELLNLAIRKPGDARVHVFISGFYRSIGAIDKATEHIAIARSLSPTKQAIIMEQGVLAYLKGDYEAMHTYFKEAFELQEDYDLARTFYATSFMYLGAFDQVEPLIEEKHFEKFALNDFAFQSADQFKQYDLLEKMFRARIKKQPNNPQHRVSFASMYYQKGDTDAAIAVLREGIEAIPSLETTGACYIANIEAGKEPGVGCQ